MISEIYADYLNNIIQYLCLEDTIELAKTCRRFQLELTQVCFRKGIAEVQALIASRKNPEFGFTSEDMCLFVYGIRKPLESTLAYMKAMLKDSFQVGLKECYLCVCLSKSDLFIEGTKHRFKKFVEAIFLSYLRDKSFIKAHIIFNIKCLQMIMFPQFQFSNYETIREEFVSLASKSPFYDEILLAIITQYDPGRYETLKLCRKHLRTEYYEEIYEIYVSTLAQPRFKEKLDYWTFAKYFDLLKLAPVNFIMARDVSFIHSLWIVSELMVDKGLPSNQIDSITSLKKQHKLFIKVAKVAHSRGNNYFKSIIEKCPKELEGFEEEAHEFFNHAYCY